jgi:spore maturation protein CgeB
VVYRTEEERDEQIAMAFEQSDWVIKCSGVGVWDVELETSIAELAGSRVRTAFWDVDAPATLTRLETDSTDPFHDCVPRFDHVFTYGGGPPVVRRYLERGARACTPIYNALDPEAHRPPGGTDPPTWDLLFMGNRLPDRERRVEDLFLAAAELCPDARFALGGEGWSDREMPPNVSYLGHVPTAAHNETNAAARLVLNIHRESMVENGWSPATRMFEAAGAAACQVTDVWRGIEEFFEPGEEILLAEDAGAVARYVRSVSQPDARRIGENARRRALREHTYTRRAVAVDEILRAAVTAPIGGAA